MEEFDCIFSAQIATSRQEALLCGNNVVATLVLTGPRIDGQ